MNVSESFRAFADCLREPAVLVSTSGDVVALNAAAGTLLGVTSSPGTLPFRLADFQDLPADSPEARSGFLAKPFTRGTLVGRVKALLDG